MIGDNHFAQAWSSTFTVPQRRFNQPEHAFTPAYTLERPAGQDQMIQLVTDVAMLKAMIFGASISTVCNGDGTITTTLTWGG